MYLTSHSYQKYGWSLAGERKCWFTLEETGLSQPALVEVAGRRRAEQTEEHPCRGRGFLLLGGVSDEGIQLFQLAAPRNHVEQRWGQRN